MDVDEGLTLDVPTLRRILDGRYAEVRDRARVQVGQHADVGLRAQGLPIDEYRDLVLGVVRQMTATGITTFGLPTAYGGGGDLGASVAAFETLAFGDLSVLVKVGVQFGLFGGAVLNLGTSRHHEAYLADIAAARLLGCFAMTETGHGSDVQSLETTATFLPATDEFEIHTPHRLARKNYIGNAARHGRVAVVFAQLHLAPDRPSQGVHAFVVPLRDPSGSTLPGIDITDDGPKIGLNGVDNGQIGFDHVRVPRTALLDRHAGVDASGDYHSPITHPNRRFFTMIGTLVQGRVSVGGAALAASKVALTIAVKYALRRRQFGGDDGERLLLDHRMHRRRLLPLVARTYALHVAQASLVDELDELMSGPVTGARQEVPGSDCAPQRAEGTQRPEDTSARTLEASPHLDSADLARRHRALESQAAGMKALATWHATGTIDECRQACGGAGYMWENRLGALRADTDVFTTFEGDNHVLLQLVGKGLLTGYDSEFDDLDPLGTVRMIAGQAVETVIERTAVHQLVESIRDVFAGNDRWDAEAGIRDHAYQLAMVRWREEHQLAALARRMKHMTDQGLSNDEVFERVQLHLVACGRSHVEREVLEAFDAAVRAMDDGPVRDALTVLCELHALSVIESDRGWWFEHGRLSAERGKEITRTIDLLCDRIRPVAEPLVDAFGVPRECWDVPMLDQRPS